MRTWHPNGIASVFDLVGDADLDGRLGELTREGGHLVSMRRAADEEALKARGVTGTNLERMGQAAGWIAIGVNPQ